MNKVQDLNIQIKRFPENKNYQVNLLVIKQEKPDEFESYICQSLQEIFERIADFEQKYLDVFENAIEYKHIDWRELARENRAKQGRKPTAQADSAPARLHCGGGESPPRLKGGERINPK